MWPAIIGAGASLIGGLMANSSREKAANAANAFSAQMASTRHQREVADLRAAGLNPILSATQGGSGSPIGQMWQPQDVLSPAVSSALDAKRTEAEVDLKEAETNIKKPKAAVMGAVGGGIERVLSGGISSAVEAAVTSALDAVLPPESHALPPKSLPAKAKSALERYSPFEPHSRARDLRESWDWGNVWNMIERRYLGNSAKQSEAFEEARQKYYRAYPDPKTRNTQNLMEWYRRNYR